MVGCVLHNYRICCLLSEKFVGIARLQRVVGFYPLTSVGFFVGELFQARAATFKTAQYSRFFCKTIVYILLALPFSIPSLRNVFIIRLVAVCVLFVASVAIVIVSIKLYGKFKDTQINDKQPDAAGDMSFKELGRLNVFSAPGTFCPMLGGFLALFFCYTPAFFILGIPLIAVGTVSMVYRTVVLIKKGKGFVRLPKIIVDDFLIAAVIVLSLVFTTAEITDTESGFTITHDGSALVTIGFLILYVGTLAVLSHTNRKTAVAYFKRRNDLQNNELF